MDFWNVRVRATPSSLIDRTDFTTRDVLVANLTGFLAESWYSFEMAVMNDDGHAEGTFHLFRTVISTQGWISLPAQDLLVSSADVAVLPQLSIASTQTVDFDHV